MSKYRRVSVLVAAAALGAAALAGTSTVASAAAAGHSKPTTLAQTPAMGWSSWSSFRCDPGTTESNIEGQALVMHKKLQSHGFQYVNIDACWSTGIDQFGRLAPDPVRFPHGIKAVSDYVHGLGLKFGMYLFPGVPTDAYNANSAIEGTPYHVKDIVADGAPFASTFRISYKIDFTKPGAQAYLDSQARQLAAWDVDYLKYDSVSPGSDDNSFDTRGDVQAMSKALGASGRQIWLTVSWHIDVNSANFYTQWVNSWRADDDIECYNSGSCTALTAWANPTGYVRDTVLARFFDGAAWAPYAGPGKWSDLDSLEVGNGAKDGLTVDERRSTVTLWPIAGANFYSGDDLTGLDSTGLSLLTNDEVIGVDQSGTAGSPVDSRTDEQVWRKLLPDGSYAVALFNLGATAAPVTAQWQDIGFCGTASVRDLWTHHNLGSHQNSLTETVAPHGSQLVRVTPKKLRSCPKPPTAQPTTSYEAEASTNTLSGGSSVATCAGCSGASKVGNLFGGSAVTFNGITAPSTGDYQLGLYYATGDERTGSVSVNGGPEALVGFFPRTGDYNTVGKYTVRVHLNRGANTIRYGTHANTYSPDLDRISLTKIS